MYGLPAPPLEDDLIWTDTERFAMLACEDRECVVLQSL